MAFCRSADRNELGYALPTAMVMSLVLAVVAAHLLARSAGALRLARSDIDRQRIERGLDGAQLLAAAAVVSSQTPPPYQWSVATDIGPVAITAEEERTKLGFDGASGLSNDFFERLGVTDPPALKARLSAAGDLDVPPTTADLDASAMWKLCAPSVISPLGQSLALQYTTRQEPGPGPLPESWRIGEVWRISIVTPGGWRDERLIRFTGDATRPAATVIRHFFRTTTTGEQERCADILTDLAGG